jgi:hypothetical protein
MTTSGRAALRVVLMTLTSTDITEETRDLTVEEITADGFSLELHRLADKYGVELKRDTINDCANNGWQAGGRTIYLGPFDDPDLELVAFYHELGHLYSQAYRRRGFMLCHLSDEGLAWEVGLDLAHSDGYKWDCYSKQCAYAYDRLSTYIRSGIWGEAEPIKWSREPREI